MRWRRRLGGGDRGTFALELVLIAPAVIGLLLLVITAGRVALAASRVEAAARDGARAASINHAGRSGPAAQVAVNASLSANEVFCVGGPGITGDYANAQPGGTVTVQVTCQVNVLLGTSVTVKRTSASPVAIYRGTN